KENAGIELEMLGMTDSAKRLFRDALAEPNGIVLVTGPTGSGKTVSLYTGLNILNTEERNISTAEDPVEIRVPGINQVQMSNKKGMTFAVALRSFLRQDPDVIMVGEIRDGETAQYAIQAALTGHLVFSTLHTNDAASSISRLADLGVERFLISSTLIGSMAQRLLRRICPHCVAERYLTTDEVNTLRLAVPPGKKIKVKEGEGCFECRGTGYIGRTGIFEILPIDDAIKNLIVKGSDAPEIKREATKNGMRTLRQSALRKLAEGVTTFEEVVRVTGL
ncbi:MAG TPA: GspE/PulE family protein, partial [Thermoanaerobaculia bacterium]